MTLLQDLKFAVRLMIKDRWFTIVAATALALGIGVNNTVFTFVNAVLIRGLPVKDPDRFLSVGSRNMARGQDRGTSYLDFVDFRTSTKTFSALTAASGTTFNVSDEGRAPERFVGPYISANVFQVMGQPLLLGRDFRPEDEQPGAPAVVILGHAIWKNRYAADPAILGRTIRMNEVPSVVIGVIPEGVKFPFNADLWQPLSQMPNLANQKRDVRNFQVFGRLADGATIAQARAEMTTIAARLAQDHPATNKDIGATVMTFNQRVNGGPIRLVFLSLMGAVAFVLLIACANVANLLLARSTQRAREISVRVSLGASRWRIVRQLLVESVLLSLLSGALGFGLSILGIRWFDRAVEGVGKPYWIQFTMDGRVFLFFAAVCLGTGVIFGLAPALHVSKTDVNEVLKEGGRSGSSGRRARRWTSALIVAELALTLVLLAGAGFMIRSFLVMYQQDLGIETDHVLTMALVLPDRKYPTNEQRVAFFQRLDERLAGVGTARATALSSNIPLGGGSARQLKVDGRPVDPGEQPQTVTLLKTSARYFETLGLQLLRGRTYADAEGLPGQETAVVNQRFVSMHFPNEDPLGRRILLTPEVLPPNTPTPAWTTIVGVVPNVRQRNFQEPDPDPIVYIPYRTQSDSFMTLIIRSQGDPAAMTPTIRELVRTIDPDLPLFGIRTLNENLQQQRWVFRVFGTMFAIFAFIALVLSAVGIYAVTAYSVSQRTQEIGVRMALGAQPPQVWWLIIRRSLVQLAIGLVIGMAGAYGVGRLLQAILVRTPPSDPTTLSSIAFLFMAVSLAESFWPARKATRLDPLKALRYE